MPERSRKSRNAALARSGEAAGPAEAAPAAGKDPLAAELGRRGGLKGGRVRAERLSPERRREIAQRAAAMRWGRPLEGSVRAVPGAAQTLPLARARGEVAIGAGRLEAFRLEDGRLVASLRSVARLLMAPPPGPGPEPPLEPVLARLRARLGDTLQPFAVPGSARLGQGIPPARLAALCAEEIEAALAGDASAAAGPATALLAAAAAEGLASLLAARLVPLEKKAPA